MKTLTCLRALFFRDVRTLFRSVLAAELGSIVFWIFLTLINGEEYLGYAVLMIPALCVPVLLMKRDGGERMFPYPPWTVVLGKYLLGLVSFALGVVLMVILEKILYVTGVGIPDGREYWSVFAVMSFVGQAACFPASFAFYGREKVEEDMMMSWAMAVVAIFGCGGIVYLCYAYEHTEILGIVVVLIEIASFTLSVRLYER